MAGIVSARPNKHKTLAGRKHRSLLALVFATLLPLTNSHAEETEAVAEPTSGEQAPERPVERLEEMLMDNMRASTGLEFEARYERLRPLIGEIMAVERMARFLFGRDWRQFDTGLRDQFNEAFLDLSAATFASRFGQYKGERFSAVEVQRQAEDRALVRRNLTTGSGKHVAFDYLLTREHDQWRIVTIVTDGVSDLALKRSQYRRILESDDFEAVITRIREAIDNQRSG